MKPLSPHCSAAAVLKGIMGKIDPRYTDRRRVCFAQHHRSCLCRLLARARALFFNFFFFSPQWEHFYGNWSPCNDSSWYACSTPDSPMTSRTPRANQQPATSPTNKSPLRSPAVDAAASCHRWRQKVTDEVFTPKGDVLRIPPCVLTLLPASNNGAALLMNRWVTAN